MRHRVHALARPPHVGAPRSGRRDGAFRVEREAGEALQEAHEEERRLVVRELLPEADTGARVERAEDVRVRREVRVQTRVEEAHGVEGVRCGGGVGQRGAGQGGVQETYHRGPRGRCGGGC